MGSENVLLILENNEQLTHLNQVVRKDFYKIKVMKLHAHAHLNYFFSTNIKELFYVLKSLALTWYLCLRYKAADLTISSIEPEKYLYLFWLPFMRVKYILHTEPEPAMSSFTVYTCNRMLSKKKLIVTVSRSMKEVICRNWGIHQVYQNRVVVIYNCVASSEFQKPAIPAEQHGKLLVITLGHVENRKNPQIWLDVAKRVIALRPEVEFNWLGNGALLEEFVMATKTNPLISFLGKIGDCRPYLEKSAIYYQPSRLEPHGIAVLEAMYNRLPCVVSNVGGLPESVQENYNGFVVDPLNAERHVEALITLIDDPELRKDFAINSYHRYEQYFSYDRFRGEMDALYRSASSPKQFTSSKLQPLFL